jgi:hypothetical protein
VVTGRGVEPTTYCSESECSTSEPPGCGSAAEETGVKETLVSVTGVIL